jgi:hypothetical protein
VVYKGFVKSLTITQNTREKIMAIKPVKINTQNNEHFTKQILIQKNEWLAAHPVKKSKTITVVQKPSIKPAKKGRFFQISNGSYEGFLNAKQLVANGLEFIPQTKDLAKGMKKDISREKVKQIKNGYEPKNKSAQFGRRLGEGGTALAGAAAIVFAGGAVATVGEITVGTLAVENAIVTGTGVLAIPFTTLGVTKIGSAILHPILDQIPSVLNSVSNGFITSKKNLQHFLTEDAKNHSQNILKNADNQRKSLLHKLDYRH